MRQLPDSIIEKSVEILKIEKEIKAELKWSRDSQHASYLTTQFVAVFESENQTTLRNVTFQATYHEKKIAEDCKYAFTLFYNEAKVRYPVFQLEVYGKHQQSHKCRRYNESFYGSHVHFSDTQIELEFPYGCQNFDEWVIIFCKIAKIKTDKSIFHPHKPKGVLL